MSGNGRGANSGLYSAATTVRSLMRNINTLMIPSTTPIPSRPVFYPGVNNTEWRKGALDDGLVCRLMCSTELTLHVSGCRYTRKYYCVKSILTGMSLFAVQIDPPLPCFVNLIYASALLKHCFSFSNRELCGFFHLINTLV